MIRVASKRFPAKNILTRSFNQQLRFQTSQVFTGKVKASHPVRKFFFRLGFATVLAYGAATVVAIKNDAFQDIFVEFVPLGENVLDTVEYYINNPGQLTFSAASDRVNESFSSIKERLGVDKVTQIPRGGVESSKVDLSKLSAPLDPTTGNDSTIVASKEFKLPSITVETGEAVIDDAVKSINQLISAINTKAGDVDVQKSVELIKASINELGEKYHTIVAKTAPVVKEVTQAQKDELALKLEEQKVALTAEFTQQLDAIRKQLESKHADTLAAEAKANKERVLLEADNIISSSKVGLLKELNQIVSEKIDNERDGKLKNLESLAKRVEQIENFGIELSKSSNDYKNYKLVKSSINNLQALLSSNDYEDSGKLLIKELKNLKELVKPLNNELINSTVENLPSEKDLMKSGGVLTQNQLITRWELLVPDLRSVALLPPNAGLLGHMSSWVFSKLLVAKSGSPIKTSDDYAGNDIESVISRVNYYLSRNELDNAVEEVASLKSWARKLSDAWVVESRRKLELQFLVDIIDMEVKVSL